MSLQVWLPLNGNLNNQGLSDLTFSTLGSNTTVNNNGKIGKCYFNNVLSGNGCGLVSDTTIDLGQNQSMFCWFKFDDLTSNSNLGAGLVSQHRYSSNQGMGITIRYASSTTGYLSVNTGNGSGRTFNTYYGTTLLQSNTWYHGGYTYDGSQIKIYVNGVCEKTQNFTGMSVPSDYITVFSWSMNGTSGNAVHGNYKLHGYLNDVRIYDHTLSEKEIKELSKGLCLHYKLSEVGGENLYTGSRSFSGTWVNGSAWTTSSETYNGFTVKQRSATWGGLAQNIPCTTGDIFTISFYAKVQSGGRITSIHRSSLGNVTTGLKILGGNFVSGTDWVNASDDGTEWKKYWATVRIDSSDITYLQWRIENSIADKILYVCGMKLEKGNKPTPWCPATIDSEYTKMGYNDNIEYDCSGYGNDGSRNGVTYNSDTPRYQVSTTFDANSDSVKILPIFSNGQTMNELSVACWFKTDTLNGTAPNIFSLGANSFCRARIASATSIWWYTRVASTSAGVSKSCKTLTDNTWHHMVYTFKNGIETMYIDGVSIGTNDKTGTGTYLTCSDVVENNWVLAGYNSASERFIGSESDFKIYTTTLSAEDVKDLYQVSASIDNYGNMYGYEVVEQ